MGRMDCVNGRYGTDKRCLLARQPAPTPLAAGPISTTTRKFGKIDVIYDVVRIPFTDISRHKGRARVEFDLDNVNLRDVQSTPLKFAAEAPPWMKVTMIGGEKYVDVQLKYRRLKEPDSVTGMRIKILDGTYVIS
jgi:hypothetical protein